MGGVQRKLSTSNHFFPEMELPINDQDLDTIVKALALGGDARLYHLLKEVKSVRDLNPDGPYKKILREERGIVI